MKTKAFSAYDLIDKLVWTFIGLCPLVLYALYLRSDTSTVMTFDLFMTDTLGLSFNTDGVFYSSFNDLFTNYLDFLGSAATNVTSIFVWFVFVEFAHVFVDFICFIPRLAHDWASGFRRKIS